MQLFCILILQAGAQWGNLHPVTKLPVCIHATIPDMSRKKPENLSFEEALSELEALVDHLEQGDITLEDSLKSFERGVALTRNCQRALSEAEQKVGILNEKTLDAEPEDFKINAPD